MTEVIDPLPCCPCCQSMRSLAQTELLHRSVAIIDVDHDLSRRRVGRKDLRACLLVIRVAVADGQTRNAIDDDPTAFRNRLHLCKAVLIDLSDELLVVVHALAVLLSKYAVELRAQYRHLEHYSQTVAA